MLGTLSLLLCAGSPTAGMTHTLSQHSLLDALQSSPAPADLCSRAGHERVITLARALSEDLIAETTIKPSTLSMGYLAYLRSTCKKKQGKRKVAFTVLITVRSRQDSCTITSASLHAKGEQTQFARWVSMQASQRCCFC